MKVTHVAISYKLKVCLQGQVTFWLTKGLVGDSRDLFAKRLTETFAVGSREDFCADKLWGESTSFDLGVQKCLIVSLVGKCKDLF